MFCHIDADAFFASVLQRKDPRLRGKPLLALGAGGGIVIAASYPAKAKGVKTGMRLNEAKKLCPDAIVRLSDFTEACAASEQIEAILRRLTSEVEQMSVDEWFLELKTLVGGVPADLAAWARELQSKIIRSVGIGMSVGIAPTKLLAKMASEYRKPVGVTVISPSPTGRGGQGGEGISNEIFLKDRPVAAIPGIGRSRQVHAASLHWQTAYDFAYADQNTVVHLFGRPGCDLQDELKGIPRSSVIAQSAPPQSISRGRSFRCTYDQAEIFGIIVRHVSICILRMRGEHLACRRITVWLRDSAFHFADDHMRLPRPMATEDALLPYVRHCFENLWRRMNGCTQVGLALCDLITEGPAQYSLFQEPTRLDRAEEVQSTLDLIRTRFGRGSIMRATGLEKAFARPHLPNTYGHIGTVR